MQHTLIFVQLKHTHHVTLEGAFISLHDIPHELKHNHVSQVSVIFLHKHPTLPQDINIQLLGRYLKLCMLSAIDKLLPSIVIRARST